MYFSENYFSGLGVEAPPQMPPLSRGIPGSAVGLAVGAGLGVLMIPSLLGAGVGALIAKKGDRAKYAFVGALAVPLIWILMPSSRSV